MSFGRWLVTMGALGAASVALAQDWSNVPIIDHSTYQAVNTNGSPAYTGSFPIRLRGVVLNNTEDWLDPSANFSVQTQWPPPPQMGGQAEFYVQAVDLDGTPYDPDPVNAHSDFGGTASWMGQNYGNLPFLADPLLSHSNTQWTAELGRLGLFGGDGVVTPLRAGDLVEVRGRVGLHYEGKFNVNEAHSLATSNDFDIVVLQRGYGLPDAMPILLSDLKTSTDEAIFDSTRQTGGEHYQSTLVELRDVYITSPQVWNANSDITVTDGVRTLSVHLGLNPGFDGTALYAVGEPFSVTGILDQAASDGFLSTDGYRLLAMAPSDFVPEPGLLNAAGVLALALRRRERSLV